MSSLKCQGFPYIDVHYRHCWVVLVNAFWQHLNVRIMIYIPLASYLPKGEVKNAEIAPEAAPATAFYSYRYYYYNMEFNFDTYDPWGILFLVLIFH